MNKVWTLAPGEDWICDRMVQEWNDDNPDIITKEGPWAADVVWLLADWCWRQIPYHLLKEKKVVTTVHHIVPEKFGVAERNDFDARDTVTDHYHVYNQRTYDFIRPMTMKPVTLIPYWANQKIFRPTADRTELRFRYGLPSDAYVVGSFQRDTEGHDLKSPKLEKGPDLLADAIIALHAKRPELMVMLAGWRRQYIIGRLTEAKVPHQYVERPKLDVINELYQTLDLYLVTARHEGGPQALIECGLLNVPVVTTPVGIAEQVLPSGAIDDDVTTCIPTVPSVDDWTLPKGYRPYREFFASL